jgi:hypothetical protein
MPELLAALDAFLQERRRCGDLDAGRAHARVDDVRLRRGAEAATRPAQ